MVYRFRKEARRILIFATGTKLGADNENFVHAGVKRIGIEGVRQFVNQCENHSVHFGILWTPTAAIDAFVIGKLAGRFVKLRIVLEQFARAAAPGLMTETIDLGDDVDD